MQGVVPSDNSPGWKQIDEPLLYNVLRLVDIDGLALIRHGENRTSLEVVAMLIYTARRNRWQQPAIPSTVHGQYGRETGMFMHYEPGREGSSEANRACSYVRACATSALKGH